MTKTLKVIKRDGNIKNFDEKRIEIAITNCYEDIYGDLNSEQIFEIENVVSDVVNDIVDYVDDNSISVEEIQDIVIENLKSSNKIAADSYESYMNERTQIREKKFKIIKEVEGIINGSNKEVLHENANKKGNLASTQRDLMAGELSKLMARQVIPLELMKEHDKGAVKFHDLDYFINPIFNCDLINLEDMLQNGTVINKKLIEKPKSLRTAMTIVTQISAQVSSFQYGGQTISLSHIAPFVRISKEKITEKYKKMNLPISQKELNTLINNELKAEIKDSVQTFNYQINTLQSTNGQTPFLSVCIYLNENPKYAKEVAMLAEEIFKQRIEGIKNEYGVKCTQTFPKLLYFLDENNTYEGSEYFWLTQLACKSTSIRMNPDFISVKKMKNVIGYAFPCMGCRAFLSPFKDKQGNTIFYGRGNLGVQTVCLPYVALESKRDNKDFFNVLDKYLNVCKQMGELRFNKLKNVKASVAPILWQHGAIARLKPQDDIIDAIIDKGFTVTLGYSGIYEAVKVLTGKSHTTKEGFKLALKIMKYLESKCLQWKQEKTYMKWALYGTPQEATTDFFCKKIRKEFGEIKDVTDKGFITNSYHVDVREKIDAFSKFEFESHLQDHSLGGAVSYCEVHNMSKNPKALLQLIQHIYETTIYGEINFESDTCGRCHYQGIMEYINGKWVCPNCGCDNIDELTICRRVCGYLSDDGTWNEGRTKDITNRVKHL